MGQGDKKAPYEPERGRKRCDVTGRMFPSTCVRQCHNEAVCKRYGVGGICNVCIYICMQCRHAIKYEFFGGVGCELEQNIQKSSAGNVGGHSEHDS